MNFTLETESCLIFWLFCKKEVQIWHDWKEAFSNPFVLSWIKVSAWILRNWTQFNLQTCLACLQKKLQLQTSGRCAYASSLIVLCNQFVAKLLFSLFSQILEIMWLCQGNNREAADDIQSDLHGLSTLQLFHDSFGLVGLVILKNRGDYFRLYIIPLKRRHFHLFTVLFRLLPNQEKTDSIEAVSKEKHVSTFNTRTRVSIFQSPV